MKISKLESTSLDEYIILPGRTRKNLKIDLSSKLGDIVLKIPILSAAMQAVTGPRLAIELARQGGLGIIYASQPIEDEANMVRAVKKFRAGFVDDPITVSPNTGLKELKELYNKFGYKTYPITENGNPHGKFLGLIDYDNFILEDDESKKAIDFKRNAITLEGDVHFEDAKKLIKDSKEKCIAIIDENGYLKSLFFRKDVIEEKNYPNQLFDSKKRLMVGAAVNTHDYEKRVPELIKAEVDVLVIDSSDGYSDYQIDTLKFIKKNYDIPVVCGNVVTKEGFEFLAYHGADAVKVGMGVGSICITSEVKGVGRGQMTALIECGEARDEFEKNHEKYVPIISDGSVTKDKHIVIALTVADFVMLGRYFARFEESPSPKRVINGNYYKEYWGEGSQRARNWMRYNEREIEFVEEGVEVYVPYAGKLENGIKKTILTIKEAMKNIGASSIKELHEVAVLERLSPKALEESGAHSVIKKF